MRIQRYTLFFCGDALRSAEVVARLVGQFVIDSPESIGAAADEWGAMSVHPPAVEITSDATFTEIGEYEQWFPDFVENNADVLNDCGVDSINILLEVFSLEGEQCNFEIFSRETLVRLAKFNVALPISFHVLSKKQMRNWALR